MTSIDRLKKLASQPFSLPHNNHNNNNNPSDSDDDDSVNSNSSQSSHTSQKMSAFATNVFKEISPHLPVDKSPKILRLISDSFATAQSRISTAESQRNNLKIKLRQSNSVNKNLQKMMDEREKQHSESMMECRKQRDDAMKEVGQISNQMQTLKVQTSVMNAAHSIGQEGNNSNSNSNNNTFNNTFNDEQNNSSHHHSHHLMPSMRNALQREFEEKKNLLEQRWDHALELVTEQMKKQRDEQVALSISKFDVEQRLKFQAEISKGLERVESAARQEVSDLTKLALKMHATVESLQEKNTILLDENSFLKKGSELYKKTEHTATTAAIESLSEKELEAERLKQKLTQNNVLIEELQSQVEEWKARSDGDWYRTRLGRNNNGGNNGGNHSSNNNNNSNTSMTTINKGIALVKEEEKERNRRRDAVNQAMERLSERGNHNQNHNFSNSGFINHNRQQQQQQQHQQNVSEITDFQNKTNISEVAIKHDDEFSLGSASASGGSASFSEPMNRRELLNNKSNSSFAVFGDAAGGAAARVELSQHQPSALREHVNHPRLDALLQSF